MGPNPSVCMVSAVLLFMGASMVIDPNSFMRLPQNMVAGFRNFELRLRRLPAWRVRTFAPVSPSRRIGVRVAGVVLIALGLLSVAVA